ncbi:hypothetical protein [Salisaeta longa]|uniref:hypothetical protein n=1 Tax=Salisaeta longa TaxID=503170 RepID=UPI0012F7B442|nr:hypothetical protein [Salisaeta longa]
MKRLPSVVSALLLFIAPALCHAQGTAPTYTVQIRAADGAALTTVEVLDWSALDSPPKKPSQLTVPFETTTLAKRFKAVVRAPKEADGRIRVRVMKDGVQQFMAIGKRVAVLYDELREAPYIKAWDTRTPQDARR